MPPLRGRDPWGWRQQLGCVIYVALVSSLVVVLAIAGYSGP